MESHGRQHDGNIVNICLTRFSDAVSSGLNKFFYRLGVAIGSRPVTTILVTLAACCVAMVGFLNTEQGGDMFLMWATDQHYTDRQLNVALQHFKEKKLDSTTLMELPPEPKNGRRGKRSVGIINHDEGSRVCNLIIVAKDNVLTVDFLNDVFRIYDEIMNFVSQPSGFTFQDVCFRTESGHCRPVLSLLTALDNDRKYLEGMTDEKLLNFVQLLYQIQPRLIKVILGRPKNDSSGRLVSAEATTMAIMLRHQPSPIRIDTYEGFLRRAVQGDADLDAEEFEDGLMERLDEVEPDLKTVKMMYKTTGKSFDSAMTLVMKEDVQLVFAGYFLVFLYAYMVLGNVNCVESQVWLALAGTFSVLLGTVTGVAITGGITDYLFTPVHIVMAFVLLGIGIDDMFVIAQSFHLVSLDRKTRTESETCGLALRHAGVLITVTTASGLVAFGMGARNPIETLRSFCMYTFVGLLCIYLLQVTIFTACCVLDSRRMKKKYNSFLCLCYRHQPDWKPPAWSSKRFLDTVFDKIYSPLMARPLTKGVVLVIAASALAGGVYGAINVKYGGDYQVYADPDSDLLKHIDAVDKYFANPAYIWASIFIEKEDLYKSREVIAQVEMSVQKIESSTITMCWYEAFAKWLAPVGSGGTACTKNLTQGTDGSDDLFRRCLLWFLTKTTEGIMYRPMVSFENSTSEIKAARLCSVSMEFRSILPTMKTLLSIVEVARPELHTMFLMTPTMVQSVYMMQAASTTVIADVLWAMVAVSLIVLLLTANIPMTLFVCVCITMAVIELIGALYFLVSTFEGVTALNISISLGLLVDYSLHVGHTFLSHSGTRSERIHKTMNNIGPPLVHGGFSTFMAFVPVAFAQNPLMVLFAKFYMSVVVIGLFNGLFVLPVLLSLIGPPPHGDATRTTNEHRTDEGYDGEGWLSKAADANGGHIPVKIPRAKIVYLSSMANGDVQQGELIEDNISLKEAQQNGDLEHVEVHLYDTGPVLHDTQVPGSGAPGDEAT